MHLSLSPSADPSPDPSIAPSPSPAPSPSHPHPLPLLVPPCSPSPSPFFCSSYLSHHKTNRLHHPHLPSVPLLLRLPIPISSYLSSYLHISLHIFFHVFQQTKGTVCGGSAPVGATCRVKGSATTFSEGDSTSQVLHVACSTAGLLCLNANQTTNTTCDDYQIQFTCDGR